MHTVNKITISAITGNSESTTDTNVRWVGRKIGKAPRKDLILSNALPLFRKNDIAAHETAIVSLINENFSAYVRRTKCQRLELGDTYELNLPETPEETSALIINWLTEQQRERKSLTIATLRATILSSEYKTAAAAVLGDKLANWQRIGEREFLPLVCMHGAAISASRVSVLETVLARLTAIAEKMPAGSQCREVLVEAAAKLAALPITDDITADAL